MANIKKVLTIGGIALACLVGKAFYEENFCDKINDQKDFVRIIEKEESLARKDSPAKQIYWRFGRTPWGTAASAKISEKNYLIILDQKRTRTAVRHELYHVYAGHCDRAFAKGDWTTGDKIRNEITANIYAWYGLRL